MRDQERIDRILNKLRDYWMRYPDLRLGQIVANATPERFVNDPFYVEDVELEEGIATLASYSPAVPR